MGKISVDAFLREYGIAAKQKDSAMETFIKKHIVVDYVNFINKEDVCNRIVEVTCHSEILNKRIVIINSPARYILFIMNLISLYTDIDIIFEDGLINQYDKLNKAGAISVLIDAIPEAEYSEFNTILNMKIDDFMNNEYSLISVLRNFKEELSISKDNINSVIETIMKQEESE